MGRTMPIVTATAGRIATRRARVADHAEPPEAEQQQGRRRPAHHHSSQRVRSRSAPRARRCRTTTDTIARTTPTIVSVFATGSTRSVSASGRGSEPASGSTPGGRSTPGAARRGRHHEQRRGGGHRAQAGLTREPPSAGEEAAGREDQQQHRHGRRQEGAEAVEEPRAGVMPGQRLVGDDAVADPGLARPSRPQNHPKPASAQPKPLARVEAEHHAAADPEAPDPAPRTSIPLPARGRCPGPRRACRRRRPAEAARTTPVSNGKQQGCGDALARAVPLLVRSATSCRPGTRSSRAGSASTGAKALSPARKPTQRTSTHRAPGTMAMYCDRRRPLTTVRPPRTRR